MQTAEIKTCPLCQQEFTCNSRDIVNCHCYAMRLSDQERIRIQADFDDCLCAFCLGKHTTSLSQTGMVIKDTND
jgi:hypothetical protein